MFESFNESHAQTILKTRKFDMAILSAQTGKNPGMYSVSMRQFLQKTIFRVLFFDFVLLVSVNFDPYTYFLFVSVAWYCWVDHTWYWVDHTSTEDVIG